MRPLSILFLLLISLSCKENSNKQPDLKKHIEQNVKDSTIDKNPVDQPKDTITFPVLNDKNAMEFFLQYEKEHKENKVRMTTDFGTVEILLFNETKFHRANFIYLTKRKYFNDTQFYRVINNYIVQAGNSDDMKTSKKRHAIGKYLLPRDTKRGFKHDRGVLSMPSSDIDNPYKLASPYEFFIVQQTPGAYFLDGDYTIFGKVTKGMDVIDKIAAVDTDDGDWPMKNVYIKNVEIIE
ncbi:peptidylprolyl isomerase [Flavobacteriaceae bacterium MHTCC 0001]